MIIINIIHYPIDYSLWENDLPTVEWTTSSGEKCAIWDGNWSQILGDEILKLNGNNIQYEVWRPDVRADKILTHVYPNGLVYRLFPSQKVNYFYGLKKQSVSFSKQMIEELERYRSEKNDLILHLNAAYRHHDKLILDAFFKSIPVVAQFYTNPLLAFESSNTLSIFKLAHRYRIKQQLNDYYSRIKNIIPSTQEGLSIFEKKYGTKIYYRENTANFGIDFSKWNQNTTKEEARNKLGIDSKSFVFFSSSRLVPEKQIDLMLIEFSKIKSREFLLFLSGNGPAEYEEHLKSMVKKFQLDKKINFVGFVSEEDLKLYYSASDVFISSSKSEAGPMSTALAALYELPVITTNTGLLYELFKQNGGGVYLDKDNSEQWHKEFSKAVDGEAIPLCPKQAIIEYFDWKKIAEYYAETYKSVLNNFNK